MKNINGTGSVVKLKGSRRRPYIVKITVGYNQNGHPIQQLLSDNNGNKYFASKTEAETVRIEYLKNKGTINLDKTDYTFKQVYEEFIQKNFPTKEEVLLEKETHQKTKGKMGVSITNNLKSAYNKCDLLYDKLYKSLKKEDFYRIIIATDGCATVINSLANLFRKMDNYALEHDIITKGYANLIKITDDLYKPTNDTGTPYSYQEIEKLWKHSGNLIVDITLVTIYTGLRIEEVLFTKNVDINISQKYFIAGLKTKAGKKRVIPIHSEIFNIIKSYYNLNNEFLFTSNTNNKITYNYFLKKYKRLMKSLGMEHKTHDGRKTLRSELDRMNANKVCINKILGHKTGDIGEDTYTKKSIEELKTTIELVKYRNKKHKKITYLAKLNVS